MIGLIDFDRAAARVEGTVQDLGWIDFETMMSFDPKVRHYVLELGGPGYTVPFQLNRSLYLVWVEARHEPTELPYAAARERVVADYIERHQQVLYRATVDSLLTARGFRFFEERLREAQERDLPVSD